MQFALAIYFVPLEVFFGENKSLFSLHWLIPSRNSNDSRIMAKRVHDVCSHCVSKVKEEFPPEMASKRRFFLLAYCDLVLNFLLFLIVVADEDSEVEYRPRRRARVDPPVTDQTDDEAYEVCTSLA